MSGGAPGGMQPSEGAGQSGNTVETPLATERRYYALMDRFSQALFARARHHREQRSSATLTDADLDIAYRELTTLKGASKLRRGFGDLLLIVGGFIVPLNPGTYIPPIAGILIIVAGLFIREGE